MPGLCRGRGISEELQGFQAPASPSVCRLLVDEIISHFLSHYCFKKQKQKREEKGKRED